MNANLFTEDDTTDFFFFKVLHHALDAVFKNNDFAIHNMVHTVNIGNAVADADNGADFLAAVYALFKIANILLKNLDNRFGICAA